MTDCHHYDVLILGSGIAGLALALQLAAHTKVVVISKGQLEESASLYAQGGVSVVLEHTDSLQSHINDTIRAGVGLSNKEAVCHAVENAREVIEWLIRQGVSFTKAKDYVSSQSYHLTQEGGHSHRRIIHSDDATGREIETSLLDKARINKNIKLLPLHIGIDIITSQEHRNEDYKHCHGCYVLDIETDTIRTFTAPITVLATGGAGKVYLYTSNPDVSTGDGIAMGWRAGCHVANMEFIQFHPTCLYHPKAKSFLISEALRGEGAKLVLADNTPFMAKFHQRAELAPRDIVARAIDHEMKRSGDDCVYLNISHKSEAFIREHFPTINQRCLQFGIDITREAIPVVPAAHYTCGGIITDIKGRTNIKGLYAIGETTHTGLHGANRMASNSLLECLVFADSAAKSINKQLSLFTPKNNVKVLDWDSSQARPAIEAISISHNWDELRRFMWDYVGIVRSNERLLRAHQRLFLLQQEIRDYYKKHHITRDLLELRNIADVAELIIISALKRKESRGLHYTIDYPDIDISQLPQDTIIKGKS
ncbi:MAG: L-aspartate oxidase [Piscirickettsiaceae bacterium]|nr:L-aspartate oxidase [Piscirickettsiaceae bacterium]